MAISPLLHVKSADELAQEEAQAVALQNNTGDETRKTQLAAHIQTVWERVKVAKQPIAQKMIDCLRARKGQYSSQKLAEIRSIRSSEVYLKLTKTKCRNGEAWVRDVLNQPSQKPWAVEPTPVPELPPEVEAHLTTKFYEMAIMEMLTGALAQGQPITFDLIQQRTEEMKPEFEKRLKQMIYDKAKERCLELEKHIEDALVEGGFYIALDQSIYDLVTFKACCIKGPIFRQEKIKKVITNPETGMFQTVMEQRIIAQYDRVNPFDIFPDKSAKNIQDGDLVERTYYRPDQLLSLLGVPGYIDMEILAVLKEWGEGTLKDWQTDVDQERAELEKMSDDVDAKKDTNLIPCLIWWGLVSGKKLKECGITPENGQPVLDDNLPYHATGFLIGNHVIKARLNDDPIGEKPYSSTAFEYNPDSVWGESIPELIEDIQSICNAVARALVNNVGIASGPMVEMNRDRFPDDYDPTMWAWKVWESENSQMTNSPAINFYQPPLVAEKLISVFQMFAKLADEQSGVPAYAHGDPQVQGAGNALANYEKILTPDGPTEIGKVRIGDLLVNTYGSTSKITGVYPQGERDIFRVKFNHGEYVDCDIEHRWSVRDHQDRKFRTLTTQQILNKGLFRKTKKDYRNPSGMRPKWMVPLIGGIEFAPRKVKIDPYTMGALLGDGDHRGRITSADREIFERIPYALGKADESTQHRGKAITHTVKGVRVPYREYGLRCKSTEKFIPEDYLYNTREVRLELLRGLMDTDGCCSKAGEVFFSTSSLRLANDFRNLIKSLGGITNGICQEDGKEFTIKGRTCIRGTQYRVVFNLTGEKIFHLTRKQKRVTQKTKTHKYIVGIEYIGVAEATCITVDAEDELFVCANYIPTHNTASGLSMLMTSAARGIKSVIKNVDTYLISPSVQRQFEVCMEMKPTHGILGDVKIQAKGSASLASKEQQGIRLMEFARETNNPLDVQLTGIEGRKYLLKSAASALNIDAEKAFPIMQAAPMAMQPGALPPANNQPNPSTLDVAGQPAQGTDTRQFSDRETP